MERDRQTEMGSPDLEHCTEHSTLINSQKSLKKHALMGRSELVGIAIKIIAKLLCLVDNCTSTKTRSHSFNHQWFWYTKRQTRLWLRFDTDTHNWEKRALQIKQSELVLPSSSSSWSRGPRPGRFSTISCGWRLPQSVHHVTSSHFAFHQAFEPLKPFLPEGW